MRCRLGKYSLKPIVFDPLNLSTKYDLNWLREAEIKCVRVTAGPMRAAMPAALSALPFGHPPRLCGAPAIWTRKRVYLELPSLILTIHVCPCDVCRHGRVCMLAVVGWLTVDAGIKFPGSAFEGVSALQAHDEMVKSGHMWALLAVVGACEALHMSVVVPRLDGDWTGYEPGNYGLDPFKMSNEARKIAELKNGRLAMLGFSGLVTQAALGAEAPYTSF